MRSCLKTRVRYNKVICLHCFGFMMTLLYVFLTSLKFFSILSNFSHVLFLFYLLPLHAESPSSRTKVLALSMKCQNSELKFLKICTAQI